LEASPRDRILPCAESIVATVHQRRARGADQDAADLGLERVVGVGTVRLTAAPSRLIRRGVSETCSLPSEAVRQAADRLTEGTAPDLALRRTKSATRPISDRRSRTDTIMMLAKSMFI
jgi:hypothetical protein